MEQIALKMKNIYSKHARLLPVIALLALILTAFRQPGNHSGNHPIQDLVSAGIRNHNPNSLPDTLGRPVRIDSAQSCIEQFPGYMKKHGFSNAEGEAIRLRISRTNIMTTSQAFDGKDLLEWLSNTAKEYDAANKKLIIKIEFGIYNSDFLNTYQGNPGLRKKYLGRVGVFLIPYDSAQMVGQGPKNERKINFGPPPPPPGDGTGYDLGGIYP